ncbi:GNAT family N-acetyltransferase [Lacihabitans soyangensis]|uniref:GNAT family N-acetyltransferase n=1 Tax=Lacihabitans soyangensis TaxID=869394 RepID=A0AAE3H1E8_9BACT|nr:GNAT family N-acetyltransferase [Lacihabitans soyangensis]MCP9763008.1 GNAT family N-acetyltransferase [Lacihabitans soyangensis]
MRSCIYIGKEIETVVTPLAALRIEVFRDFPYLYEGSFEYEKDYLQTYVNSERAFLFAVFDNEKMVGATTCIPLIDETAEVKEPFEGVGMKLEEIFYFGESILLKEYRGKGIGKRFFEERERHVAGFGNYTTTCFCAVDRPENHPLWPKAYVPLDEFWESRGYKKSEVLKSKFSWKDINEPLETEKTMIYWLKKI